MSRKTRKLMWSVPLIAAVAVIGALAAFMTLTPKEAAAQASDIPGMVQNLTVEAHEDGVPQTELLITWDPPAGSSRVTGYRIDISLDGDAWVSYITNRSSTSRRIVYPNTQNPGIDTALKANETRHFRVFALNREITGAGVSDVGTTEMSEPPGPPTGLTPSTADSAPSATTIAMDLNGDGDTTDTLTKVSEAAVNLDLNGDGDLLDTNASVSEADVFADVTDTAGFNRTVISLTWTAPSNPPGDNVTGYDIERSSNGTNWHLLASVGTVTTYYDMGLRAGETWHYQIRAKNSKGMSGWADSVEGSTAAAVAPVAITAPVVSLNPAGTDVYLSWTAPANTTGNPVTHYRIQARANGSTTAHEPVHSGSRQIQVTGETFSFSKDDIDDITGIDFPEVIPDTGYSVDVRIAAINTVNTNAADTDTTNVNWFNITGILIGHKSVPRKVTGLGAGLDQSQNEGRSGINLVWDEAEYIDTTIVTDQSATEYIVVINGTPEAAATHANAVDAGGNTTRPGDDDDNLRTETERKYRVYAQNTGVTASAEGTNITIRSIVSDMVSRTTASRIEPGTPSLTTVTTGGHTEIELVWVAPTYTEACEGGDGGTEHDGSECGDSVLEGYIIEYTKDDGATWKRHDKMPSAVGTDASPYVVGGLDQGTRYGFRIRSSNGKYESPGTSQTKYATTTEAGKPTPPGGLVAQAVDTTTIKLCWYEQNVQKTQEGVQALNEGLPILEYKVSYVDADGNEMPLSDPNQDLTSGITEFTDSTMMPGSSRTYRVRTVTIGGTSELYAETTGMSQQAAPANVTATTNSATSVTLTWDAGGDAITGYEVERKTGDGDFMAVDPAHSGTNAMYMDTTVTADNAYTYRVRSVIDRMPPPSAWAEADASTQVPAAPTGVTADSSADGTMITVSWTASADRAGAPVTGYKVVYKMYGSDDGYTNMDVDAMSTSTTVEGLTLGTAYTFRVIAINAAGESEASESAMETTHDVPGAPTGVTATKVSDMQIDVEWTAPASDGGADIMGYVLSRKSGDGDYMTIAATDAGSWWNALNCEMMNAAIPDDATPAPPTDHTSMDSPYCVLYAGLSTEADAVVHSVFDASYDTITGTSYMDMGLMEMTMYTYQVKAVNAAGASMASDSASATTDRTNVAPVAGAALTAMVTEGMTTTVQSVFTDDDPEDATLMYTSPAMSSNSAVATATVDAMGMVTIMGVSVGTATITVTATDTMGASAMQEIMVTVESADTTLGAPSNVMASYDDTDPGRISVTVTWTDGANAAQHAVILFDSNFDFDPATGIKTGQTDGMTTFLNVASGDYTVVVVAMDADFEMEIGFDTVTVP